MPEIVIISGKGGTGKTSLTACFAHLAQSKVICDLDVDAPDLHIILDPKDGRVEDFRSGHKASIDPDICIACGQCAENCRFEAIRPPKHGGAYAVDPIRCEGCGVCAALCPQLAILMRENHCGRWAIGDTRFGTLVHAQLFPGEENSGRLVTLLKRQAKDIAKCEGLELILSDGTPGVGCPVISSLAGADLAVIVTEPTPSGRHDLERVASLCAHFRIRTGVIINKVDLNPDVATDIRAFCRDNGHVLLGELPYHPIVTEAMLARKAVTEMASTPLAARIRAVWNEISLLTGLSPAQP